MCRLIGDRGSSMSLLLATTTGQSLGSPIVMLQASAPLFAYEPILKALQDISILPLDQYITAVPSKGRQIWLPLLLVLGSP